ncbi:MAG: F0F1 ATP synthase subunit A [Flavobacteriales bacterium]
MNKRIALFFGLLVATATTTAWAEDSHDHGHEQEAFNPSNFIIHHIADAHEIHLWGDVHIPLPIIVYTAEHGLDVFMSSAFEGHGDGRVAERPSGVTYELSHGHIAVAGDHAGHDHGSHDGHDHADHAGHDHDAHEGHDHAEHNHHGPVVYDLSITKSIFGMLLMLGLMVVLFGRMAGSYKNRQGQAPTGMTNALEPLVVFLRDEIAIPNIGKAKADKFLPFLMTVFFFIFFANLLGLVPFIGGFNVTGTLGITMVLASLVFLITTFNGNKHYWGHLFWPPGVPLFVMPIIVPIEIVGMFLKPIVLMIRLTANISAGHIIILSFVSLILIFGKGGEAMAAGYGIGIFSTAFMIFMYCLELLVAFLQAFVFTLLAAIYFGEATHEAHH